MFSMMAFFSILSRANSVPFGISTTYLSTKLGEKVAVPLSISNIPLDDNRKIGY
jgi:hypothetical protein